MTPVFIHVCTNGKIFVSGEFAFSVSGSTVLQSFRVNPNCTSQLLCTLTGSGNASASALSCSASTTSGKGEGNEVH